MKLCYRPPKPERGLDVFVTMLRLKEWHVYIFHIGEKN